jgi:hypothetical protein
VVFFISTDLQATHQRCVSGMAIGRSRDVCTALYHPSA